MFSVARCVPHALKARVPACARWASRKTSQVQDDAVSLDPEAVNRESGEKLIWALKSEDDISLPPLEKWRKYFPSDSAVTRERAAVRLPSAADAIAEAFVPEGSEGKVIIEAYPGK
ncbi:hypothetical protein HGRIS_002852 [Hohenbuehelia grisea]|uniref:Uncharacterized protein n=1 Tax=Hohenbuehelia grisea TaxID=104357 RepID=A0ABR3JN32_9AGAR